MMGENGINFDFKQLYYSLDTIYRLSKNSFLKSKLFEMFLEIV